MLYVALFSHRQVAPIAATGYRADYLPDTMVHTTASV
jgi:hypothetical protein